MLREYAGNEAKAQMEYKKRGTTLDEELDEIKRALIISSYREAHFMPAMTITRSQLLRFYRANLKDKYTQNSSIEFRLIDIRTTASDGEEKIQEALAKIKAGEDFGEVAKEYSQGWRRQYGGLWNSLDPGSVRKQYIPVIKALEKVAVGKCTDIIRTDGHLFIAQLVNLKLAEVLPLSEVQDDIEKIIIDQRWQHYTNKISQELLGKAVMGNMEKFLLDTIDTAYKQLKPQS